MTSATNIHRGVADRFAELAREVLGGELPIRLRAWDGSEAGPADAPVLVLRNRSVLRRLLWQPNELGLAQAYVAGEIDIEGDFREGLQRAWHRVRTARLGNRRISFSQLLRGLALVARFGGVGPRPPAPVVQAKLAGTVHSRERDRAAVSHHYDLSNEFYQLILDPSMAYSCAYWTSDGVGYTLEHAQRDKLQLICRKLDLGPGVRMLDVGCGWGSLTVYAASTYGARVAAVTISRQQRDFVADRVAKLRLADLVEVRLQDYRDVDDGPYDAVASVEMGEHVGAAQYPAFAARLHRLLRPGGRLLVQQMSRGPHAPGGGPFIESYVAPDMHMRPIGETVQLLERAGLEVRDVHAMREHYVPTILTWLATLEQHWADVVKLVNEATARIWRLYLAGAALTFAEGRMGVDQILAVRPTLEGATGMAPTREGVPSSVELR